MNPSVLEWSAVALSLLGVWLMAQRKVLAWPIGLLSVGLYAAVFAQAKLYSDALLQLAFAGFLGYGWWKWFRQKQADGEIRIVPLRCAAAMRDVAIGLACGIALGALMQRYTDASLPWLDAMLAALSLVAQWWETRRHAATWWLWILVDVAYIGIYLMKSLYVTAALYMVFIGLAVIGLRHWNKATVTSTNRAA